MSYRNKTYDDGNDDGPKHRRQCGTGYGYGRHSDE